MTTPQLPAEPTPPRSATPDRNASPPPDPSVVLELLTAFRRSKTMFAAVRLGVFDALAASPQTADALAKHLSTDPNATARLLDACVGLALLTRDGDRYANTPAATAYLSTDSPRRLTGYLNYSNDVAWKLWAHLEDAIQEGSHRWTQVYGWEGPIFSHFFQTDDAKREFLMGMHGFGVISSPEVVAAFDLSDYRRLVDVGGATGHLALAACQHWPNLTAAVFDLPEAVPLAKQIVSASPVADRVEVLAGDFFTDALPEADLYALGRILHDWSDAKCERLLSVLYERLPVGGAVLIAEKLLDDDRSGPSWAQMQDLNMLVCTEGRERTLDGYRDLLARVGFADVAGRRTDSPLDAILARKT